MTNRIDVQARQLTDWLKLETRPVAVFLVGPGADEGTRHFQKLERHRYCQALMQARAGKCVRLVPEELTCPAAAAAFGFKPLPEGLQSGKGLLGFGIVRQPETGCNMFKGMTTLAKGSVREIALCPLEEAPREPDVIVQEAAPEQLMWLLLADLNRAGGERRIGNTAVLQATCVDATIIPYTHKCMNFSLGCYGCREATDLGTHETVLGFHGSLLNPLMVELEHLATRALPRSRAKRVFHAFTSRQNGDEDADASPFQKQSE